MRRETHRVLGLLALVLGLGCLLSLGEATQLQGRADFVWFTGGRVVVLAAVLAVYLRPGGSERRPPVAALFAAVAAAAVSLALLVAGMGPMTLVSGVLGASTIYLIACWFDIYVRSGLATATRCALLAISVEFLLRWLLSSVWGGENPTALTFACPLGLLALSAACLVAARGRAVELLPALRAGAAADAQPGEKAVLGRLLGIFALFGAVCGVAVAAAGTVWSSDAHGSVLASIVCIAVPLLILGGYEMRRRVAVGGGRLAIAGFVAGAVVLGLLCFDGGGTVSAVVSRAFPQMVGIFTYLYLLMVAARSPIAPMALFAVGRGAYRIAYAAGVLACDAVLACGLFPIVPQSVATFSVGCLLLLVVGGLFAVLEHGSQERSAPLTVDERCSQAAAAFGLTAREADVMRLTAAGLSKKQVANELGVAEDTVRHHLRNVYTKLDVHSKQEMLLRIMGQ